MPLGVKHIFGIFDGHGGDSVAEFCRSHLIDGIVERLQARHSTLSFPSGKKTRPSVGAEDVGDDGPLDVADCVREMCREVDAQVGLCSFDVFLGECRKIKTLNFRVGLTQVNIDPPRGMMIMLQISYATRETAKVGVDRNEAMYL